MNYENTTTYVQKCKEGVYLRNGNIEKCVKIN